MVLNKVTGVRCKTVVIKHETVSYLSQISLSFLSWAVWHSWDVSFIFWNAWNTQQEGWESVCDSYVCVCTSRRCVCAHVLGCVRACIPLVGVCVSSLSPVCVVVAVVLGALASATLSAAPSVSVTPSPMLSTASAPALLAHWHTHINKQIYIYFLQIYYYIHTNTLIYTNIPHCVSPPFLCKGQVVDLESLSPFHHPLPTLHHPPIHPSLALLLFLHAAFEMFLHLTASSLCVRAELVTATPLLFTQGPHLLIHTHARIQAQPCTDTHTCQIDSVLMQTQAAVFVMDLSCL